MNADGCGPETAHLRLAAQDQVPDWSPDGSKIAYLADTHGVADMGNSWGDIWVMNADGSDQHAITNGASWYGTAWSPDGTRIATLDFPSRTLYTVNAANGNDPRRPPRPRPPVRPRLATPRRSQRRLNRHECLHARRGSLLRPSPPRLTTRSPWPPRS